MLKCSRQWGQPGNRDISLAHEASQLSGSYYTVFIHNQVTYQSINQSILTRSLAVFTQITIWAFTITFNTLTTIQARLRTNCNSKHIHLLWNHKVYCLLMQMSLKGEGCWIKKQNPDNGLETELFIYHLLYPSHKIFSLITFYIKK